MVKDYKNFKISTISDLHVGEKMYGFFVCREKNILITQNGTNYMDLLISDISGLIRAKLWQNIDFYNKKFDIGQPIAIKGIPVLYNGKVQINISQINLAKCSIYQKYGFKPELIIKTIKEDPKQIYSKITNQIKKIKLSSLRVLCHKIYEDNMNKILSSPASLKGYYSLSGGLVMHISNSIDIGLSLLANYKNLNKDLIVAGLLLKDIGKINFYTGKYIYVEEKDVKNIGHEILSIELITNATRNINNFPIELKRILFKMIIINNVKNHESGKYSDISEIWLIDKIKRLDFELDNINQKDEFIHK